VPACRPPLTVAQILIWADAHFARTGAWPKTTGRHVLDDPTESWQRIDQALRYGSRSLRGGDSLARLLARERGVRNRKDLPPLTEAQIEAWARAHHAITGRWPTEDDGAIPGTRGEAWRSVAIALWQGHRGLPGGDTLARLLARRLGVRNWADVPVLDLGQVLAWAEAHRRRTGRWPHGDAGDIPGTGETWAGLEAALANGHRGLPGGLTLAGLLRRQRRRRP
jgi:hypothetical protein